MLVEYTTLSQHPTCLLQSRIGDVIRFTGLHAPPNRNYIGSNDICLFKIKTKVIDHIKAGL